MNILQGLPAGAPLFCVTPEPGRAGGRSLIWQRFVYEHPLFNPQSWSAQLRREEINGQQRSWYCGAYWYNGFHEDGGAQRARRGAGHRRGGGQLK